MPCCSTSELALERSVGHASRRAARATAGSVTYPIQASFVRASTDGREVTSECGHLLSNIVNRNEESITWSSERVRGSSEYSICFGNQYL